jgi:hypothetical protein
MNLDNPEKEICRLNSLLKTKSLEITKLDNIYKRKIHNQAKEIKFLEKALCRQKELRIISDRTNLEMYNSLDHCNGLEDFMSMIIKQKQKFISEVESKLDYIINQ